MMGVESLKMSGAPRLRCLDVFLVVSIVFLFVALALLTIGVGLLVLGTQLQPPALSRDETGGPSRPQSYTSDGYKMQNFAYLQANRSALINGTMTWAVVPSGAGGSVGSRFVFHEEQHAVELTRAGHYFLYVDLKLTCTRDECDAAGLTVRIGDHLTGDHLTCAVELPRWSGRSAPLSHKCWQVAHMDAATRLIAQMTVHKSAEKQWTLDVATSGQGIFLVD